MKILFLIFLLLSISTLEADEDTGFDRDEPCKLDFDFTTAREGKDPAWSNTFVSDKKEGLRPTGFLFKNVGPNAIVGSPIDPKEESRRDWKFVTEDNSKRETYLWITDDAGSGFLSQMMETIVMILPRKMKPSIIAVDDELHITLPTGELVVFNKKDRLVKSGVFQEGLLDINPDRFKRKFAPLTYTGTGITIRIDKRGDDPRLTAPKAVVSQNGATCEIATKELWNSEANFKFISDEKLLELLNKKCNKKFSL
jgi:hypothetical protein